MKKQILPYILAVIFIFFVLSGCTKQEATVSLPDISGKHIVLIIAPQDFNYQELHETKIILESAHGTVTIASTSTSPARSSTQEIYLPDISVNNLSLSNYNAVVFIGGPGMVHYFTNPIFLGIAKNASSQGKILGAICVAPVILANAGLLSGLNATVFSTYINEIQDGGANFINQPVVTDHNLVTANGPDAAKMFGTQLVNTLAQTT